jgi:4-hydroxy-3-methylbut-2-enyl diphosphate reductase
MFMPGDSFKAVVLDPDKDGRVALSKIQADAMVAREKLEEVFENKQVVDVFVDATTKGGVTCEVFGLRGFIPASHLALGRVEDLSAYVGKRLKAHVIELDLSGPRKKIIVSRRDLLKEEKKNLEKNMYEELKAGDKRQGIVSRITDFGAFIDLGGVDGLLHVSAISWDKVKHPSDVLHVGQEITVLVQSVDAENRRISLNVRDLLEDPWFENIKNFSEGSIVDGKVTKLTKFGAFVLLGYGIEGLVHVSEIAHERVESPDKVLQEGQEVKVKILKIDRKAKKVSLSIAKAKDDEDKKSFKEFIGGNSELRTSIGAHFGAELEKFKEE